MLDYVLEILYSETICDTIWNNKSILLDGKSIYFWEWHKQVVSYIQNLLNGDGTWKFFEQFSNNYKIKKELFKVFKSTKCSKTSKIMIGSVYKTKSRF